LGDNSWSVEARRRNGKGPEKDLRSVTISGMSHLKGPQRSGGRVTSKKNGCQSTQVPGEMSKSLAEGERKMLRTVSKEIYRVGNGLNYRKKPAGTPSREGNLWRAAQQSKHPTKKDVWSISDGRSISAKKRRIAKEKRKRRNKESEPA